MCPANAVKVSGSKLSCPIIAETRPAGSARLSRMNDAAVRTDDGCRLWALQTGHGPPLVLCHGGPGLWDMFDDLAPTLADAARVVRWDQRGCGRSERRGPFTVPRPRFTPAGGPTTSPTTHITGASDEQTPRLSRSR
jgi:pimeloyl-ACP methyl ester carboxylesterase